MRLSHETYIGHVRADADRIATVAGRGLEPAVPSCPGWTVRDAVEHTAEVYRHKIACMRENAFPDPWPPPRGDQPTLEYFEQAAEELLAELSARDPREFAVTWWWDEQTVGFWGRRLAHESAIHRVDVELAHDAVTAIDEELAVDGIDEVLRMMLAGDWSDEPYRDHPPALLRIRSGNHAWRVVLEPMAVVASVDKWPDAPVDAVLTGDPVALYRWLWGRGSDANLTWEGDAQVKAHLHARMRQATQ